MPQYVVLHHRPIAGQTLPRAAGPHFDWMFDHGQALLTWATDTYPTTEDDSPILARRLTNHRRIYLTFEGPLSDQRGEVERIEAGEYELVRLTVDYFECKLIGPWRRTITFQRNGSRVNCEGDEDVGLWSLRRTRAEAS